MIMYLSVIWNCITTHFELLMIFIDYFPTHRGGTGGFVCIVDYFHLPDTSRGFYPYSVPKWCIQHSKVHDDLMSKANI